MANEPAPGPAAPEPATGAAPKVGPAPRPRPATDARDRERDLADLARLQADLVASLPTMKDRSWQVSAGLVGTIHAATKDAIEIKVGGAFTSVPWSDVAPDRMVDLFRRDGSRDPYALAVYCFDHGLPEEGSRTLQALLKRDPSTTQRAFGLISRARGVDLPEGGFLFHGDRWLTPDEHAQALLLDRFESIANRIRSGRSDEVQAASQGIDGALADASARPELVERGRTMLVEALGARREGLLDKLRKHPAMVSLERMKTLKRDLNVARAEALKTIFDLKVYPDEDHGRAGQPAVDAKVRRVRELWEKPADAIAGADSACREMFAAIRDLDAQIQKLGGPRLTDEGLDRALEALSRRIDLRSVALDDDEQRIADHNRKVWAWNAKVESSMTPEERKVVALVNEYREMMGLRILEFDDALAKAARGHSQDMERRGFFAHETPDGKSPSDRCFAAGYPRAGVGENIAMGMDRPEEAHNGWYNSSGHHRNMLQAMWTQMGCGRQRVHWTENFGAATCESK